MSDTTIIDIEQDGNLYRARVRGDENVHAVWAGHTKYEALGKLVTVLSASLGLKIMLIDKEATRLNKP